MSVAEITAFVVGEKEKAEAVLKNKAVVEKLMIIAPNINAGKAVRQYHNSESGIHCAIKKS